MNSKRTLFCLAMILSGCGEVAPYSHVLDAPDGVDRWEPSGAVVVNDRLWVATDRMGWIAAYALPLREGSNHPALSVKLLPTDEAGTPLEQVKWEEIASDLKGGFYLLEARTRKAWHCSDPESACTKFEAVDLSAQNADIDRDLPGTPNYFTFESLGFDGEGLWMGSRFYEMNKGDGSTPYVILSKGQGPVRFEPLEHDGRRYALSGIAFDGQGKLWQTWSFEGDGDKKSDVSGLLAISQIDEQGQFSTPEICRAFVGKPEGVAVYGDQLILVFDQDKDRKKKGDKDHFQLEASQDYATIIPASCKQ